MSTNVMGLTEEEMVEADSSAIAKVFEPLSSGVYDAVVKSIVTYKNQWGGEQARYTVTVKDSAGEDRTLTFRSDIGKTLQDKTPNKGYGGRLKQFSHATGVAIAKLTAGETVKIKTFGKEVDAQNIEGMNGKSVRALVRLTDDSNKAEGQPFKITNDILGVVKDNGTEDSGRNAEEEFLKAIAKTPVFIVTGKTKKKVEADVQTGSGEDIANLL